MRPFTCTAEDLARDVLRNEIPGGTFSVCITPSAPGGCTFRAYEFRRAGRFAVGGGAFAGAHVYPANTVSRPLDGAVGSLTRTLVAMARTCDVLGLWRDERGRLWVDTVDLYENERDALRVARERGELAIWDGIEGREIAV